MEDGNSLGHSINCLGFGQQAQTANQCFRQATFRQVLRTNALAARESRILTEQAGPRLTSMSNGAPLQGCTHLQHVFLDGPRSTAPSVGDKICRNFRRILSTTAAARRTNINLSALCTKKNLGWPVSLGLPKSKWLERTMWSTEKHQTSPNQKSYYWWFGKSTATSNFSYPLTSY